MISAIDKLLKGDETIAPRFAIAKKYWDKFFLAHRADGVDELADALGNAQSDLEFELDLNRGFAKDIMPVTAIASLYDEVDGFGDNRDLAQRVVYAFERSMVSLEVKGFAIERVAILYSLDPPKRRGR